MGAPAGLLQGWRTRTACQWMPGSCVLHALVRCPVVQASPCHPTTAAQPPPSPPPPPPSFHPPRSFYYQAEVQGQTVTWLVPHATSQVLPPDVDYKVMLTFLEFYQTLLKVGGRGTPSSRQGRQRPRRQGRSPSLRIHLPTADTPCVPPSPPAVCQLQAVPLAGPAVPAGTGSQAGGSSCRPGCPHEGAGSQRRQRAGGGAAGGGGGGS